MLTGPYPTPKTYYRFDPRRHVSTLRVVQAGGTAGDRNTLHLVLLALLPAAR